MIETIYEGYACEDCACIIANDDDSGCTDPMRKRQEIAHVGLGKLGNVVMACPEDCEGEFRTDGCDYCGTSLGGMRHPLVVLADVEHTQAYQLGYERGVSTGNWVIDGNTSADRIRAIAKGIEDGDPEVLDMCPAPLSGEWADDPTIADVLSELGIQDEWAEEKALSEYENGFSDGYWHSVETACHFHLR